MESVQQIVSKLLEDEGEEFDAREYILSQPTKRGIVDADTAMTADTFYHRTKKYARSDRPIEVRKMGATKRWVRQPEKFRVPVKFGMYDSFYIDNRNADEWSTTPNFE